ncbi:MAG: glycosyltransferase family 9 protein [Vampirovibrionales bacterium]|nr:glycosyltransferase family 9 protein [Vampirovibrionales bacterium]
MRKPLQRILVLRYRFIGDTILSLPALRVLKAAFPQAQLDVLCGPVSGQVLANCPYINALIPFNAPAEHRYERPPAGTPEKSFLQHALHLRQSRYDAAVILKRSFSSAMLPFLAGIPIRASFNTEGRRLLLSHSTPYRKSAHEADCYLDIVRALGVAVPASEPQADPAFSQWLTPQERAFAVQLLAPVPAGVNWAVHCQSSNAAKKWPQAHWQALIQQALSAYPHLRLHAFGATSDFEANQAMFAGLTEAEQMRCFNWAGQTSLRHTLACLDQLDGLIGVDSGTPHLNAALGKPTLTLFSQQNAKTPAQKWQPLGPYSQVINAECLETLLPEAVWTSWQPLIEQSAG